MQISEQDLLNYQICSRRAKLHREKPVNSVDIILSAHHFMAIWMWTYQIIHSFKVTERALKEKWALTVKSKYIKEQVFASTDPVTDLIALGYPILRSLYEEYLRSSYTPVASMVPLRYTVEHVGVVNLNAEVICVNDLDNKILLNYSEDNSYHDTTTNLLFQTRISAAKELGITRLVNTRLNSGLVKTHIDSSSVNELRLKQNISHVIQSIQNQIDIPILNCKLNCPYRDICE
jgi:hypothetical protein